MADGLPGGGLNTRVHVVWGAATEPTTLASYDAALAEAGVGDYNLVTVSSVVPAGVPVEPIGTAPDLGPAGNRLTVVEARVTVGGESTAEEGSAGLAWATGPGPGLFYEVAGPFGEPECRERLEVGLDAGRALREWTFEGGGERTVAVESPAEGFSTGVVLGVYGTSDPIM